MAQKALFDELTKKPRAAGTTGSGIFADVALNFPHRDAWTYTVPESLAHEVAVGKRVRVPFGRRRQALVGYVVRVHEEAPSVQTRAILEVLDEEPLLDGPMLELARKVAEHYCCTLGQVLEAMLPAGVRRGVGLRRCRVIHLVPDHLERLQTCRLGPAQRRILEVLARRGRPVRERELLHEATTSRAALRRLVRAGLIQVQTVTEHPEPVEEMAIVHPSPHALTTEQQRALERVLHWIEAGRHRVLLLFGVTGSGKTEVYLRAIERVIQSGKQAIVLVPEISLTPQTRQRFVERFGRVALLHSHLSPLERHAYWRQIRRGDVAVVIGARSAVFAPCPRLGLIVLDEEHEASFKQETVPRYHARTVAILRAAAAGVPVLLGSATPSLESWARAQSGAYELLRLSRRIHHRPLPRVTIIDLRHEKAHWKRRQVLSEPLRQALQQTLAAGGQALLFLNRRGFATIVQCRTCGEVLKCRYCETSLVYHRAAGCLLCHTCDYHEQPPERCPACREGPLHYAGSGTERLEAELQAMFPGIAVARMDADTMRTRGAHERALERFRRGEARILLGTQMVTKGLDFPNVTLVGVVNADVALHLPDFRAAERTFQLVAQVAGRTGRGEKPGEVIVQSYRPQHPAIQYAAVHDYEGFAREELAARQRLGYPPYRRLVRVVVRSGNESLARQTADELGRRLRGLFGEVSRCRLLGPAPAPLARLQGEHRVHLQLFVPPELQPGPAVRAVVHGLRLSSEVSVVIDVDPISVL